MVHFCLALKAELQDLVDKLGGGGGGERALLGREISFHEISPLSSASLNPATGGDRVDEYREAKRALIQVERYEDEIKTILLVHVKQIAFELKKEGIIVAPSLVLMSSLAASVNITFSACACPLTKMAGWQDWDGSSGPHERVVINRVGFLLKACERAFCTCPFTTHLVGPETIVPK
jgi:hypothetical protein